MVGIGTVLADNPALTCRLPGMEPRSPVRVVVDSDLKTPLSCHLVQTAATVPTWIIAGEGGGLDREAALRSAGVEVLRVTRHPDGRIALQEAVTLLATRGITRLMVEGGPSLAEGLATEGLIDEAVIFDSPLVLGAGLPAFAGLTRAEALAGLSRQTTFTSAQRPAASIGDKSDMFTGIITDIGEVTAITDHNGLRRLTIVSSYPMAGIALGASIAHAGICLTVTSLSEAGGARCIRLTPRRKP